MKSFVKIPLISRISLRACSGFEFVNSGATDPATAAAPPITVAVPALSGAKTKSRMNENLPSFLQDFNYTFQEYFDSPHQHDSFPMKLK